MNPMKPWPKRNQPNRLPPRWSHTRLPNVPWFSQAEFNFEQKDLHGPGLKVKWLAVRFYVFWLASWTHRHSQTFTDVTWAFPICVGKRGRSGFLPLHVKTSWKIFDMQRIPARWSFYRRWAWFCYLAASTAPYRERVSLRDTSSASLRATPRASLRDTSTSTSSSSSSSSSSSTIDIFHHPC